MSYERYREHQESIEAQKTDPELELLYYDLAGLDVATEADRYTLEASQPAIRNRLWVAAEIAGKNTIVTGGIMPVAVPFFIRDNERGAEALKQYRVAETLLTALKAHDDLDCDVNDSAQLICHAPDGSVHVIRHDNFANSMTYTIDSYDMFDDDDDEDDETDDGPNRTFDLYVWKPNNDYDSEKFRLTGTKGKQRVIPDSYKVLKIAADVLNDSDY
jgi:hypothetical protein